ncbi:hypothetical protein C8J57DRAFT_1043741 [Mycena rebaudengoi]|nr:hypothetical protein C8J57DRAFT_1043741 [Mycena rebaudengoi]
MTKAQEAPIRGRYTSKACNILHRRKSKCDGVKPSCGSCMAYGRGEEASRCHARSSCSWGRDSLHRKPRTEAHFEALRSRADALQAYVSVLEGMLAKCVCQDVSAHHQFRPPMEEVLPNSFGAPPLDSEGEPDSDEEVTYKLRLPLQFLKASSLTELYPSSATSPSNEPSRSQNIVGSVASSVDGVDETACDLNFDWSRHLPKEIPLDRKEHDKILDLFFKFFCVFTLPVVPCVFLQDMHRALSVPESQPPPKTPNYSPMLHNAILALASAFSDDPRIQDTRAKESFMAAARDRLEAECQKPDLSLVHALGLMGIYLTNQGAVVLGDCHHAMRARVGQALGLGVASEEAGRITSDEIRDRNYAYWALFSSDVLWALHFGREAPSLPNRKDVPMPLVSSEFDQVLWYHAPANIPPQPSHISLIFSASTSLSLTTRKIVPLLYVPRQFHISLCTSISDFHSSNASSLELNGWKSQLPPEIDITPANRAKSTPQRLMLHCLYWSNFIHLHKPFFNQSTRSVRVSGQEIDHVKLCKRAAENTLELLETWSKLYSLRYSPIRLLPFVFNAGTIFILLSLQATRNIRVGIQTLKKFLSQAELCVHYLHEMGQSWTAAASTARMLQGLIDSKLEPVIARRGLLVGIDQINSNPAPLASDDARTEALVPSDNPVPLAPGDSTSWDWHEPQDTERNHERIVVAPIMEFLQRSIW